MQLDTKFSIDQRVKIKELDHYGMGTVVEICISRRSLEFKVQYFLNGKIEVVWLAEHEIEEGGDGLVKH